MRALVAVVLCACTSSSGTTALFAQNGSDFYDLPYPNDLRRHDDGSLDLSKFPTKSILVDQYRADAEKLDGFGLNGAMFARFSGALDETSLPDPAASTMPGASVYLVNLMTGERTPIIAHFRPDKTNTIGDNRLAVRPYPGFGLDEGATYALVITSRVRDASGAAVEATDEFRSTLANAKWYAPLKAYLAQNPDDVVSAAVFTTQHATDVGLAIRKGVFGTPAPTAANLSGDTSAPQYAVFTGTYTAPNFQTGEVPYSMDGGEIQIGSDGAAIVQRMEPMRFALTLPPGPVPESGFPICIYAHGTGGDYQSFIQDGTAMRLAAEGIAVISTDQVLHGPRNPGGNPEVAFFNFSNPYAGRDNALQGAADAWSQMRLALGMSFPDRTGRTGRTIHFDPDNVFFFGHSQGGLTGPAFIAFEPTLKGAVLSGTGGILYLSLLYKTAPVSFPELIASVTRDNPIDEDNPTLALAQMWIERADGANYARLMVRNPPPGNPPKNIFQTEGFTDTYAPNPAIEAFATSLGGDIVMTANTMPVEGLTLRGRTVMSPPIMDNDAGVTAVLAQYNQRSSSDGHFVVFDIPAAQTQSSEFLGTLASTGHATVVSP
jgi:pimeloyl-ACP methyl ester carboxylesterase